MVEVIEISYLSTVDRMLHSLMHETWPDHDLSLQCRAPTYWFCRGGFPNLDVRPYPAFCTTNHMLPFDLTLRSRWSNLVKSQH